MRKNRNKSFFVWKTWLSKLDCHGNVNIDAHVVFLDNFWEKLLSLSLSNNLKLISDSSCMIGLCDPMIEKVFKKLRCIWSPLNFVHRKSRVESITGLVSVPNLGNTSRDDDLKTGKNRGRRSKEFVAALAIKKFFLQQISTICVIHNKFKSFLDHKLVN